MKHTKKVLAVLLALVMVLSCFGTVFAAEKPAGMELTRKTPATEITGNRNDIKEETVKGFKSVDFRKNNTYQYADDEVVRAIIILDGETEADAGKLGSTQAVGQRLKLQNQHKTVFKAMKGIDYELKYEYTRLLNGFSCDVAYGDLEAISNISGVQSVHIANSFAKPVVETPVSTNQVVANEIVGNTTMHGHGYTGAGIVVAVLDTGLNLEHEAFQDAANWVVPVVTEQTIAAADLWADGKYVSAKIPFAYDYADGDADVTDHDGHGTHVSGSAVGLAGEMAEDGKSFNVTFAGAAPAAQLLSMKIFSDDKPGTTTDIYFYALEDAYALGADVINMSIGAQNGFTYDSSLETEVFGNIYKRLTDDGVILSVAAGNEYSMAANAASFNGYAQVIGPEYTDYGTVASPSTYNGNVSVASMENAAYPDYVIRIDGADASFVDSCADGEHGWVQNFGGQELAYQAILNAEGSLALGTAEDFAAYEEGALDGKIVIVSRGEIDFETKVENAYNAGAIGCIVVNNAEGIISMSIETFEIPAISLQVSALELLSATGTIEVPAEKVYVENPSALLMSDFSNWGTSPMLTLDPAITGVGGRIYSAVPGGTDTYEVYSGTSMAAPNMTGMYATVLSAIYEAYPDMEKTEAAELAKDLIYSSAAVLTDADDYPYSPRKTGAGVGIAPTAIDNLMRSAYITNPLQELGDDPQKTGVYKMSVELKNDSEYDVRYGQFEAVVLTDELAMADEETIINTLTSDFVEATMTYRVDGKEVTEVELAAGESVTIDVTIILSADQKDFFDTYYPNGAFVEGYVVFNEIYEGDVVASNHATFLAYYGDWTQASVLEETDFMDIIAADQYLNTTIADAETGETYADLGLNWANAGLIDFYTNPNSAFLAKSDQSKAYAYAGDSMLGYVDYYPEHIAFSTPKANGTYMYADAIYMEPYLLRNAEHLIMTVTDKETGEVYYVDDTPYLPKAMFDNESASWMSTGAFMWDGKDAKGNYVPSGTVATITYDAILPYGKAEQKDIWGFDVTVDYTAPVLENVVFDKEARTLTVTASDSQYLQGIYLANDYGEIVDQAVFSSNVKGEAFTATFDVSALMDMGTNYINVVALDYATNEMEQVAYFFDVGVDATITLNTPYGSRVYEVKTGDKFTFPAGPVIGNGNFTFWSSGHIDHATDDTIWGYVDTQPWYFEGDKILVDGDITVYALYNAGEIKEYEQPNYYFTQDTNCNGTYALCGWNYDAAEGNYLTNDPIALNSSLTETVISEIENAVIGDYYIEFFTSDPSVAFNLTSDSAGRYTIQSADGKYMALVNGELAMVDAVSNAAKWNISICNTSRGMLITNAAAENMILLYNDDEHVFEVMDNSKPIDWILEKHNEEIYPSQYYQLVTYKCQTTYIDEESSFYSTTGEFELIPGSWSVFEDVSGGSFYFDAVEWAVEEGITTGTTSSTFNPEGDLQRAQFVTMLWRDSGSPEPTTTVNPFKDVKETDFFYKAVLWAAEEGITTGISATEFAPFGVTNRAQAVTFLWRYLNEPAATGTNKFSDVVAGEWYAAPINWAVGAGVTNGMGDGTFGINRNCNRAQAVTFLYRALAE